MTPLFELVTPIPFVALQQMFNASAPWGMLGYEKALYLDELSRRGDRRDRRARAEEDLAVVVLPDLHARRRLSAAGTPTPPSAAAARRSSCSTSTAAAPTRTLYETDRAWVRDFWDAMRPHATGVGGYVNFMAEADEDRVRASYGAAKYARLHASRPSTTRTTCSTSTPTSGRPERRRGGLTPWLSGESLMARRRRRRRSGHFADSTSHGHLQADRSHREREQLARRRAVARADALDREASEQHRDRHLHLSRAR